MDYLLTAVLSLVPIVELRGGIPFAILRGIPWYIAGPFAAAVNILVAPLCWLFLSTIHRLFYGTAADSGSDPADNSRTAIKGFAWYRRLSDRFIEKARQKLRGGIDK
jgi:uncharacterized membrane protein